MKNNLSEWEKKLEKKMVARAKKGKPKMRVSGASVKALEKIIRGKV
ncbi:MAG: hypothetical protein WC415_00695 [Patescibacteria group bacterium]|jgi:hypothetical protein